jgi:hypothetical protein
LSAALKGPFTFDAQPGWSVLAGNTANGPYRAGGYVSVALSQAFDLG